jgi:L,D-peptidoglycan transpeptidase YkuD (ErfK/YbiS/YcfS/YnhG family)
VLMAAAIMVATSGWAQSIQSQGHHPATNLAARQLLVVVTNNWSDLQGKLYAFEKHNHKWVLKFTNAIVVGSKGLGMGDGLVAMPISDGPIKHEGDMKSPAGIFTFGTAFGYADSKDVTWIKNPYIRAFDTLICVDDMRSPNYNKLVDKDTAKSDYKSFEYMHLKKDYYKWGLFINHNTGKTVPGDGSCVFLHIWGDDHTGTAGCTAMTENNVLRILHWINARDKPLLVQLPVEQYRQIRAGYNLPKISYPLNTKKALR